ncbi:MAG: P-II family nitrogen regulator [Actinobacteria bacterium]|nr:P-II family nitrogen regulator [Actinomycetota bacterium]MBW3649316.1 P-II family nitrogen regulator [Actinomycetota bacterium]
MKLVTAVIKPHMLEPVKEGLKSAGVQGVTVTEVNGFGRQGGHTETYRGAEYSVDLIPKLKVEVLCSIDDAERIVDVMRKCAHTGKIGDGKVWVVDVDRLMRVRTGEMGDDAV